MVGYRDDRVGLAPVLLHGQRRGKGRSGLCEVANPAGGYAYRLYYQRSLDGGATWQSPLAITSSSSRIADQDVAPHVSGQVRIAWTGLTTGNLYTRTSVDGGATFGPALPVGRTTN